MSTMLSISPLPGPLSAPFFEDLPLPDIRTNGYPYDEDGRLVEDGVHAFVQGLSSRGIELHGEAHALHLRMLTAGSPDDWRLGLAIAAKALDTYPRTRVKLEGGRAFGKRKVLEAFFTPEWLRWRVNLECDTIREMAMEHGISSLVGPNTDFRLGGRMLKVLAVGKKGETFADRMIRAMQRLQFPPDDCFEVEPEEVHLSFNRRIRATLWEPDKNYLMTRCDYVHFHSPDGQGHSIPFASLEEISGVHLEQADEARIWLASVPRSDWARVCQNAIGFEAPIQTDKGN